jgi:general L-amino acid transport system permease protein
MADPSRTRIQQISYLWTDERLRGIAFQLLVTASLALFFAFIIWNTATNLKHAGLASGYGFLQDAASFDINQRLIDYDSTSSYGRAFLVGGLNTVLVAVLGVSTATFIGFLVGLMRLSSNFLVSRIAAVYVELTRNIPLLLQIIFWWVIILALPRVRDSISVGDILFLNNRGVRMPQPIFEDAFQFVLALIVAGGIGTFFLARWARKRHEMTGRTFPVGWSAIGLIFGLPGLSMVLLGLPISLEIPLQGKFNFEGGFNVTPELIALWLALSLYTGAFISEVVRSGILSVDKGQIEAARAVGLPPGLRTRKIILPQALRVIIPPLTNQYLNLTKNSSLAVVIGYQDIVSIGETVLNQSGQALEVISIYMAFYLTLSLLTSLLMNWYNKRTALVRER